MASDKNKLRIILGMYTNFAWFACAYLGKGEGELWSLLFPIISWLLHFYSFRPYFTDYVKLLILLVLGLVFDSILARQNFIQFQRQVQFGWLPIWLISIWLIFIPSLSLLVNLLKNRYIMAVVLGAIFGPLSYRAGANFGTLFINGIDTFIVYSIFWGIFIPTSIHWIGRKDNTL